MKANLPRVTVYSDGACLGNPGPGGWAALLISNGHEKEISGGEPGTTNNRMELTAAIRALQALKRACLVELFTDSTYLQRGVTEWLPGWKARGWKRKQGALANQDLWQALDELLEAHQVSWHWLRGHAGDRGNERVDRLAQAAAQKGT
jgi:ribonuclease HI